MVSKPQSQRAFDEQGLRSLEDEWVLQRHRGKPELSSALLHDAYLGGSSSGARMSKADFLASISEPGAEGAKISQGDRLIRRFGETVVSTGITELEAAGGTHRFRYLRVYQLTKSGPKLVASQSTVIK
jgi:hypothetical protein